MECTRRVERLYLLKDDPNDDDIFVDTVPLPQHQYEGIRFLYRNFKKGKPGVIFNDPSGYGKRVQIVLFLNAVNSMFKLSTLILCPEGREEMWRQLFQQWTKVGSDVTVHYGHEYTRTPYLIASVSQMYMLPRREWGMLVVDSDPVSREILRSSLTAKYKIWITTIDMKKHLQMFAMIYRWLYPYDKYPVEGFAGSATMTPSSVLIDSVRLDTFMEDVVIRRKGVTIPLGNCYQTPDLPRVSRKNKDATGKKIKRSKPKPLQDQDTISKSEDCVPNTVMPGVSTNGVVNITLNTSDTSLSTLNKSDTSLSLTLSDVSIECNKDDKIMNNKLESKNSAQENTTIDKEITKVVDNKDKESDSEDKNSFKNNSMTIVNNSIIDSQNIVITYDSETPESDLAIPAKKSKIDSIEISSINNATASEGLFSMDIETTDMNNDDNINKHDIQCNTGSTVSLTDSDTTNIINRACIPENVQTESNKINDQSITEDSKNDNNHVGINKTEKKIEGIELKMKQIEELAMKKFQGSFLDSIL